MEGRHLGALRLDTVLGSGGMGTVYLATAVRSTPVLREGDRVAVKVIHPHLLAGHGFFKRFLREAEVGNRVRHENVVRTLDVDATHVDGQVVHYLVMEYVDGRTLRDLLGDLGFIPDPLLREIAAQVAAGLAAIHAAGAIHRDLKPENVLITEDDRIRIMDLGVARLVEESVALTRGGEFAGSLLYAAPEQFGHGTIGPALDLYSLGVTLYELATGKNPFRKSEPAQVMAAHLSVNPTKVALRNPEISDFLSETVARLMEKDPVARFGSAALLHRILVEEEESNWWQGREEDIRRAGPVRPRIPIHRETALYGREAELTTLRGAWIRALEGDGQVVLLDGEAGIGKTRLLDALVGEITGEDANVLYGAYSPTGGRGGVSEAIVDHFGRADLEGALRPFFPESATLVGSFAAMASREELPEGMDPLSGDALHSLCCRLMQGLARVKPLVWIVDDLQFAGPESRKVVLSMARALEEHRVLLVATSRPGGCAEELGHLSRLPYFRRIEIGRLSPREVIRLLREELQSEGLVDRLGAKIAYKSDGVPFFVFEIIRSLRESGVLVELADGSWASAGELPEIDIPSTVQDLIQARFVELEPEDRELLDVASCCGCGFDPDVVTKALGLRIVPTLRRLAQLERKHGLIRSANENFRFDHQQVQELLYVSMPPRLRREYHAALSGALLEQLGAPSTCRGDDAVALCRHLLLGGLEDRAVRTYEAALTQLEIGHRNDEALEIADLLLAIRDLPKEERARLLLRKAGRLHILGRREEQRETLREACDLADEIGDPALQVRSKRQLGAYHLSVSDFEEAERLLQESLGLARTASPGEEEALAIVNLGVLKIHQGRYREAGELLEDGVRIARGIPDEKLTAGALRNLGAVLMTLGDHDRAEAHYRDVLAIAHAMADERLEAMAVGALGELAYTCGRNEEAREHLTAQLRLSHAVGDRNLTIDALTSLTAVECVLGRLGEALRHAENAFILSREIGSRHVEGTARASLGALLLRLGETAEGREHIEASLALARETGSRWSEAYASHLLGLAAEQEGEDAEDLLGFAEAVYRELGYREGLAETLTVRGRIGLRTARLSEGLEFLDEALEIGREDAIPDVLALVPAYLALHMDENAEAARAALEEYGDRLDRLVEMEARFILWEAVGDPENLIQAQRILDLVREEAPERYRVSMVENVPLHRLVRNPASRP